MTAGQLANLDRRERRRQILLTVLDVTAAWVLLIGVYYFMPFEAPARWSAVFRLAVGIVVLAVVLVWQVRQIVDADYPGLRAVRTLGVLVPLFMVFFASTYLSLSQSSASNFNESLDHTGALYVTITVLATVGFGDIVPKTELARVVVMVQMLLDLVLIGGVVRVVVSAARTGISRTTGTVPPPDVDDV